MGALQSTGTCFLCDPDPELIYSSEAASGLALCGLGPLLEGYSVVATRKHARSSSDAAVKDEPQFLDFAKTVRSRLSDRFGSCLLTEHGRVPLCIDYTGASEPHCYHAHFLLFPAARDVEAHARSFFAKTEIFTSLEAALGHARESGEYYLFSSEPTRFLIMTRPGRIIRQFSRYLVAESLGRSELANWRRYPARSDAISTACNLRELFAR
jgi:hypothetical protein